jgi:hypothetical protein
MDRQSAALHLVEGAKQLTQITAAAGKLRHDTTAERGLADLVQQRLAQSSKAASELHNVRQTMAGTLAKIRAMTQNAAESQAVSLATVSATTGGAIIAILLVG